MKKSLFILLTFLFSSNLYAESMQCVSVLLKAKQYSNVVLNEIKKEKPNFCIIADNLEQQLNWLGSVDKYCSDEINIAMAHKMIAQFSPILLNATIKCGH